MLCSLMLDTGVVVVAHVEIDLVDFVNLWKKRTNSVRIELGCTRSTYHASYYLPSPSGPPEMVAGMLLASYWDQITEQTDGRTEIEREETI